MSNPARCPRCGAVLKANRGIAPCPACLMKLGLEPEAVLAEMDVDRTAEVEDGLNRDRDEAPTIDAISGNFPELEVLSLLGQGGMGAVYKARQKALDRFVALKIVRPHVAYQPGFADRFTREARVLARLSHPNIVTIHDFGQRDRRYYLIMEYVNGPNLRDMMRANRLSPDQALAIVPRLCEALQHAHDEGIVHRDIKPENILVDVNGRVKIADFGLAKLAGEDPEGTALTGSCQVFGTPRYMAPEQMRGSSRVDHRADIYSMGVVFYELLTGELPLGRFDPPSRRVKLDVRLDEVVLHTLEQDPARRYQRASDVRTDLDSITCGTVAAQKTPPVRHDAAPSDERLGGSAGLPGRLLASISFLTLVGAIQWAASGLSLIQLIKAWGTFSPPLSFCLLVFVSRLVGMVTGISATVSGLLAWRTCSPRWATLGAIVLMIPTGAVWLFSAPFGLWALLATRSAGLDRMETRKREANSHRQFIVSSFLGISLLATLLLGLYFARLAAEQGFRHAARTGRAAAMEFWLWAGVDTEPRDAAGMTPLMWASWEGHDSVVRRLIAGGADVDAITSRGETALMKAAFQGHTDIVEALLDAGAQADRHDRDGETALLRAAAQGHVQIVQLLVERGIALDDPDDNGMTPLLWAAWNGQANVVQLLRFNGATMLARSADGETALMKAAYQGHQEIVDSILDAGSEVNAQDRDGETALILAAFQGHQGIVGALLNRQADLTLTTREGITALMAAARQGHAPVVRKLLAAGTDISVRDTSGRTALDQALCRGEASVIDVLVDAGAEDNGALRLWQAMRSIQQGRIDDALPLLEQAATATDSSSDTWQFTIDRWSYTILSPRVFVWLVVGQARSRVGPQADATEAFRRAQEAMPPVASSLPLYRRTSVTEFRTVSEQFALDRSTISQHIDQLGTTWRLHMSVRDQRRRGSGQSIQTSESQIEVADFFPQKKVE